MSDSDSSPPAPPAPSAPAKPVAPAPSAAVVTVQAAPAPSDRQTRVGKFIQTYHTFLSTFVIGAAGLIATSIWQYKQSEIAKHQAEAQQAISKATADNQWRIERAEILSKNLQVLAARGEASADSRYGVLLSLTRGEILDPELAVSYALELGKDNAEYMKSVLSSTADKDYVQLAHAFTATCDQKFGRARQVDLCKTDELTARSDAIARLISDEAENWAVGASATPPDGGPPNGSPMVLLRDERQLQKEPARLMWLFAPAITAMYQRNQFDELRRFSGYSTGAHVVEALLLAQARTGELRGSGGRDDLDKLHAAESKWLADYLSSRACDDDCRGRFAGILLTGFAQAKGDYDDAMRRILTRPTIESGPAVGRLHARMSRCQVEPEDIDGLRDRVLVPALGDALAQAKPEPSVIDNLTDLVALAPDPTEPTAVVAHQVVLARLAKTFPDKHKKGYVERRAAAENERKNPPATLKKVSFCKAPEEAEEVGLDNFFE